MAGAYLSVPLGRDYQFQTNVALALANITPTPNLANANFVFMAKSHPDWQMNSSAAITSYPTASGNVLTTNITAAQSNVAIHNALWWEISCLLQSGLLYTLDQGRMAITQPVRTYP